MGTAFDEESNQDVQYLEIFSQKSIGVCLHTLRYEKGCRIRDLAVKNLDRFALASEDGTVTVKQLFAAEPDMPDSFIFDDMTS